MIDKFVRSVAEALAGIKDGSTVLIAGFAQVGEPRALIDGLIETGAKDLTVVHNTAGRGREGVARLIGEGRVRKIVCSFARSRGSVLFEEVYARGEIELEILPQGTMAERIRAAAADIPAFYTATAAGTKLADIGLVRGGLCPRRDRARNPAAGHDGRAHPRCRRRHSGVLHGDRRRHQAGRYRSCSRRSMPAARSSSKSCRRARWPSASALPPPTFRRFTRRPPPAPSWPISVLFEEVYARGEIELEILPQGTMAERIRAAAADIPAFYTATAAGTKLADIGLVRGGLCPRRDRARNPAAGHDGRAHPRCRRRHSGVLHGDRRRHQAG